MRACSILACVAPVAAALTTRAADVTAGCYPSDYALTHVMASGEATNTTSPNITGLAFSYLDTDTGVEGTCQLNSTSTNLSPGGNYANYACDNPLIQFSWGKIYESDDYLLGVTETVCNSTATTTGSFVPVFSCRDCTDGTGVECTLSSNSTLNSTSQSVKFSSWNPITE